MESIGELRFVPGKTKVEWQIKKILQLFDNSILYYKSPEFSFLDIPWTIWISINEDPVDEAGFVDLIVETTSSIDPISVDFSVHFKTVDGNPDAYTGYTGTKVVGGFQIGLKCDKFISRSELLERKSELLPSGILTIICTLKKTNTNTEAAKNAVDEFRQTKEGTGVSKLQEHFKKILDNGNLNDVVLKVDGKEFKSHRCILAARSPVFQAMMTHETKERLTGFVDIPDVDADTFSGFLHYLYTGSEKIITSENVVNLFTAADKYQVDELKESCRDYMMKNISVDNFCDILSLSLVHAEKDLTDACSQFYIENSLPIVKTPNWLIFATKNPVTANELNIKQLENNMKTKAKN